MDRMTRHKGERRCCRCRPSLAPKAGSRTHLRPNALSRRCFRQNHARTTRPPNGTTKFVWLSIWGADVVSLSVTFASFLIAFSFLIGTEASNLMAAILFIFVSRVYDVGDRVNIYDSSTTKDAKPMNVTVWKIDLRTTAFRRWDEQVGHSLFALPSFQSCWRVTSRRSPRVFSRRMSPTSVKCAFHGVRGDIGKDTAE